jgi:hypothetical protein
MFRLWPRSADRGFDSAGVGDIVVVFGGVVLYGLLCSVVCRTLWRANEWRSIHFYGLGKRKLGIQGHEKFVEYFIVRCTLLHVAHSLIFVYAHS